MMTKQWMLFTALLFRYVRPESTTTASFSLDPEVLQLLKKETSNTTESVNQTNSYYDLFSSSNNSTNLTQLANVTNSPVVESISSNANITTNAPTPSTATGPVLTTNQPTTATEPIPTTNLTASDPWVPTFAPSAYSSVRDLIILPLGDSITSNGFGYFSYRYYLWKALLEQTSVEVNVDFVGTLQNAGYNENPDWPLVNNQPFDQDHEGHWGWRADEVSEGLVDYLAYYELVQARIPNIALIHLGTNDCTVGEPVETILDDLRGILDQLYDNNPNMNILLAKLIPATQFDIQDCLDQVNQRVEDLPLEYDGFTLVLVDMTEGFIVEDHTWDGLHPNNEGSERMAQKWFDAILSLPYVTYQGQRR